jgi:hypothetical protein
MQKIIAYYHREGTDFVFTARYQSQRSGFTKVSHSVGEITDLIRAISQNPNKFGL